jgi:hypothetical protein
LLRIGAGRAKVAAACETLFTYYHVSRKYEIISIHM